MLRTKLFRGFALIVLLFSVLSILVGARTIKRHMVAEAQTRARLDLSSAWAVYNAKMEEIATVLRLAATKEVVVQACAARDWANEEVRIRLEKIRAGFGLDFLDIVAPEGKVVARMAPPYATGDVKVSDRAVSRALRGEAFSCMAVLSKSELEKEAEGLAEKAFLQIAETPHARRSPSREETRGMAMVCAVPVLQGQTVLAAVHAGVLVNRNHGLIDRIHEVIFKQDTYKGKSTGTATLFLHDVRVATTVRHANGNRALGTRVSKEVADTVLDNGRAWVGEAFVVDDWYLTAYEPIRDGSGEIVGMLYVGILKRPFDDYERELLLRFLALSLFVAGIALLLAFVMAHRLSQPIHRLVEAADQMRSGNRPTPVPERSVCNETTNLIRAFNSMTHALVEREDNLKALNRSYMDMLGFVSHELKSPVASMTNYAYLLHSHRLGPLSEPQEKAVACIDRGCSRLVEMVRHYLNLARIENHEFAPVRVAVPVRRDILDPLIDSVATSLHEKGMRLANEVPEDVCLHADANMMREVFENLIGNAVKYGRDGGRIDIAAKTVDGFVEFSVRNEGEGIPRDRMGDLFGKFSRLGAATVHGQRGTGLGLFITKNIVEAHGGTIRADSSEGEWAEFVFTLPRCEEQQKT